MYGLNPVLCSSVFCISSVTLVLHFGPAVSLSECPQTPIYQTAAGWPCWFAFVPQCLLAHNLAISTPYIAHVGSLFTMKCFRRKGFGLVLQRRLWCQKQRDVKARTAVSTLRALVPWRALCAPLMLQEIIAFSCHRLLFFSCCEFCLQSQCDGNYSMIIAFFYKFVFMKN